MKCNGMAGLSESLNSQGIAQKREDCCAMARQNVEQKGYGIAMHSYELKGKGRATNRQATEYLGQETQRRGWVLIRTD